MKIDWKETLRTWPGARRRYFYSELSLVDCYAGVRELIEREGRTSYGIRGKVHPSGFFLRPAVEYGHGTPTTIRGRFVSNQRGTTVVLTFSMARHVLLMDVLAGITLGLYAVAQLRRNFLGGDGPDTDPFDLALMACCAFVVVVAVACYVDMWRSAEDARWPRLFSAAVGAAEIQSLV